MKLLKRVYLLIAVLLLNSSVHLTSQNIKNESAKEQNEPSDFHHILTKQTAHLHLLFDELLKKYVSESGFVDYKGLMKSHKQLLSYINVLTKFYPKLNLISEKEQLAYWINAYNALTIDLVLRHYPLKSIKDIKKPWEQKFWQFGDNWLSLNDIEHKILRKMNEPRIHFAIVCASVSCPKLQNRAFTSDNIEEQLDKATREFLMDSSKNKISENHLELSKIFKWFAKDFKINGTLIDFLNSYTEVSISMNAKKSFLDYNWDLNE